MVGSKDGCRQRGRIPTSAMIIVMCFIWFNSLGNDVCSEFLTRKSSPWFVITTASFVRLLFLQFRSSLFLVELTGTKHAGVRRTSTSPMGTSLAVETQGVSQSVQVRTSSVQSRRSNCNSTVCICRRIFVKFSSVLVLISSYEHF